MGHSERPSIVRLLIGTSGRTPPWPGTHRGPRVLVEAPGGRWHGEGVARAAGFEVLVCPGPPTQVRCPALAGEPCPLASTADLVVDSLSSDTSAGRALLDAHARLHPGVPVCVEFPLGTPVTANQSKLAPNSDDIAVVALIQRLARPPALPPEARAPAPEAPSHPASSTEVDRSPAADPASNHVGADCVSGRDPGPPSFPWRRR